MAVQMNKQEGHICLFCLFRPNGENVVLWQLKVQKSVDVVMCTPLFFCHENETYVL